jgi:hypothetical protein
MNLYDATVPVFTKMLTNLERWLDKAEEHARHKKFDSAVLLSARLAPDQWAFGRQVGAACDAVKWCCGKMTGKDYPSHPDNEQKLDELRARIRSVQEYVGKFKREDFVGCEDRPCTHNWMGGKTIRATDYLDHFALPNFYFHYAHAYAILRHNGIELGKGDYLGSLPFMPS